MRVLFMGSPEFALPSLQALIGAHEVAGVVTQPDRPAGRGRRLQSPPVKALADSLGLDTIQPKTLKDADIRDWIRQRRPQTIVVAAFGQIVPPEILSIPDLGCLNVHASLLPRWRGASPIQAAIAAGDTQTGVTIMRMDAGLDTGDILTQRTTSIGPDETGGELADRLSRLGAELLLLTLHELDRGQVNPRAQDEAEATYAPRLRKQDGMLEFDNPVAVLERRVRAYQPWPGTFFNWENTRVQVLQATAHEHVAARPAGTKGVLGGLPAIAGTDGWLTLARVRAAGKRAMSGADFLNGAPTWPEFPIESADS